MSIIGANEEQLEAIEAKRGVLLKAGAGSGKTYVLVERILFLIGQIEKSYQSQPMEKRSGFLKTKFSKIVVMTFTKNAAEEIFLRLHERIEQKKDSQSEHEFWGDVLESLSSLHVSTIHGFCYRLLEDGGLNNFDIEINLVDEYVIKNRIRQLFENWANEKFSEDEHAQEMKNMFLRYDSFYVQTFCQIFNDPQLRLEWEKGRKDSTQKMELDEFLQEYIQNATWGKLFFYDCDLGPYSEFADKSWYQLVERFQELKRERPTVKRCQEYFKAASRIMSPKGEQDFTPILEFLDDLKLFRKFLKDNQDSFAKYEGCEQNYFSTWQNIFQDAYNYIERNYFNYEGISFSDLEYLVLKSLQQLEPGQLKDFDYFIVDEFQDTSTIQFEILKKLCAGDYSKLFCVGDEKQAIYGFRGGELSVFLNLQEQINQTLVLKKNYRSKEKIITFNNMLFKSILVQDKGLGEYFRKNKFSFVEQKAGLSHDVSGEIVQISLKNMSEVYQVGSYKISDLDLFEARAICEYIKNSAMSGQTVVLYKNLKCSKLLISELIRNNIGFTAQVKTPRQDDPLWCLFYFLAREAASEKSSEKGPLYAQFLIGNFIKIIKGSKPDRLRSHIENFFDNIRAIGLYDSFIKFCIECDIGLVHPKQTLLRINKICQEYKNNLIAIYEQMRELNSELSSQFFSFGSNSHAIKLMTVHSSKGLEFDHVILAGIYSNGRMRSESTVIGKRPGSFKWFEQGGEKKTYLSPALIGEKLIERNKDIQEHKRLFYVACTRAIDRLSYVDLNHRDSICKLPDNSWYLELHKHISAQSQLEHQINRAVLDLPTSDIMRGQLGGGIPLYFDYDFSAFGKDSRQESIEKFVGVFSELSVTRLATLMECPQKFYLENICKINEEDLLYLQEHFSRFETKVEELNLEQREERDVSKSSAERGIKLHGLLERFTKSQFDLAALQLSKREYSQLEWTLNFIKEESLELKLEAELPLKFPLFNFMLSGVIDLFGCNPELDKFKVYDFKTGNYSDQRAQASLLQLQVYAYGLYELGKVSKGSSIQLEVLWTDLTKSEVYEFNYPTLLDDIFRKLNKLNHLLDMNLSHCAECGYKQICHLRQ